MVQVEFWGQLLSDLAKEMGALPHSQIPEHSHWTDRQQLIKTFIKYLYRSCPLLSQNQNNRSTNICTVVIVNRIYRTDIRKDFHQSSSYSSHQNYPNHTSFKTWFRRWLTRFKWWLWRFCSWGELGSEVGCDSFSWAELGSEVVDGSVVGTNSFRRRLTCLQMEWWFCRRLTWFGRWLWWFWSWRRTWFRCRLRRFCGWDELGSKMAGLGSADVVLGSEDGWPGSEDGCDGSEVGDELGSDVGWEGSVVGTNSVRKTVGLVQDGSLAGSIKGPPFGSEDGWLGSELALDLGRNYLFWKMNYGSKFSISSIGML